MAENLDNDDRGVYQVTAMDSDGSLVTYTEDGAKTTFFGESNPFEPLNPNVPGNAGTTTQGKVGSTETKQNNYPTVRKNPLGYMSSYTYQLTLYMITPDAYNAFLASNKRNINDLVVNQPNTTGIAQGGAFIICQSGGVNNTVDKRADGFDLDFYIDNLKLETVMSPKSTGSPTVTTQISFNITEPYGFSFLARLKKAQDTLAQYSSTLPQSEKQDNPSRQHYVLGIRFYGYDKYGKILTGKEIVDGQILDPLGNGNGLFETFYDIIITKINFRIDGRATVYNVKAVSMNQKMLSIKDNSVPLALTVTGTTVEDALLGENGLVAGLNKYYDDLFKDKTIGIPRKYDIQFVGDLNDLRNASLVVPGDETYKYRFPMSTEQDAPPDSTRRNISFPARETSITAAIEKIITLSTFMTNPLKVSYTNDIEPNSQTDSENAVKPDGVKYFRWFNIQTVPKVVGYDSEKTKDYVYDITFVISPYECPIILTPYVKNNLPYYGPIKRYEYWFTGQNSEIISYEQENNNTYFITVLDPKLYPEGSDEDTNKTVPSDPSKKSNSNSQGKLGAGGQADGSITSELYDPKSYTDCRIKILGDPDFLVQDSLNYYFGTEKFNQYFAPNGTTINPNNGQVFIELDFKEAVDYNDATGLLNINESISFWQYDERAKGIIKGVSLQIKKIVSTFHQGKFTQDLHSFINIFPPQPNGNASKNGGRENSNRNVAQNSATPGNQTQTGSRSTTGSTSVTGTQATSTNNGLRPAPSVSTKAKPTTTAQTQSSSAVDDVPPGTRIVYDENGRETTFFPDGGRTTFFGNNNQGR